MRKNDKLRICTYHHCKSTMSSSCGERRGCIVSDLRVLKGGGQPCVLNEGNVDLHESKLLGEELDFASFIERADVDSEDVKTHRSGLNLLTI
eukprot:6455738-Amphidinium_carterae.2